MSKTKLMKIVEMYFIGSLDDVRSMIAELDSGDRNHTAEVFRVLHRIAAEEIGVTDLRPNRN